MTFSPLSNLFRVFQHDDGYDIGIWNVSCGPIDQTYRIYRILYEGRIDEEKIIEIECNWMMELRSFVHLLRNIISDSTYPNTFRTACKQLEEDPWIEMFIKTHPLLYKVSCDDA
jgi:hypothetical protein